jgi:hypothetical protein
MPVRVTAIPTTTWRQVLTVILGVSVAAEPRQAAAPSEPSAEPPAEPAAEPAAELPSAEHAAEPADAHLDGKYLLRSSDLHLSAEDIALGYGSSPRSNAAGGT